MPIDPRKTIASGLAAIGSGRFAEAESLYQLMLADHPGIVDTHMLGGVAAANSGNRDEAIERFRAALNLEVRNPAAQNWISVLLRERGEPSVALEHAEMANRLQQREPDILCNLGLCLIDTGNVSKAANVLERAVTLRPGDSVGHAGLGKCYRVMGRDLDALREFRTANRIAPDFNVLVEQGAVLITLGRQREAVEVYEQAIRIRPDSASTHVLLSRALSDLRRDEEAELQLDRAESIDPHLSDIYLRRANVLQIKGDFPRAEAQFEKAIEMKPTGGASYHGIVSSKRLKPTDVPFVDRMKAALGLDGLTLDDRAFLHFSLGKAYDDLGDYEKAMHEYDLGNEVMWDGYLRNRPFNPTRLKSEIDGRIKLFNKEFFKSTEASSASDCPILIVGMPRSGTTLVEQILSSHPSVEAAGELSFWAHTEVRCVDLARRVVNVPDMRQAGSAYLDLLTGLSGGKPRVTDKNPANFFAVGMIHACLPNARIIHTRRDPVDTALSIYFTLLGQPPDFSCVKENIVTFTREYHRLMSHWRGVLPENRFFEVDYEDLVTQGEEPIRRLVEFCGLEWNEACLHPEGNLRPVTTPSLWQVRQPVYTTSIARWKKYEPYLGEFAKLLD